MKPGELQAIGQNDGSLWFVFRDKTSGRTTHGGARQLCGSSPDRGRHTRFQQGDQPAVRRYIPYATSPLAPPQNRLSLAIEAGELKYEPLGVERVVG